MKLSDGERLILILLCEIQDHLKMKHGSAGIVREAITSGHLWALKRGYTGLFGVNERTEEEVKQVSDILNMWWAIETGFSRLSNQEKERVKDAHGGVPQFMGFSGNEEADYISTARFYIDHLKMFEHFKGRELNAHMPTVDAARRMLRAFDKVKAALPNRTLNADELVEILSEIIHPEHRRKATDTAH